MTHLCSKARWPLTLSVATLMTSLVGCQASIDTPLSAGGDTGGARGGDVGAIGGSGRDAGAGSSTGLGGITGGGGRVGGAAGSGGVSSSGGSRGGGGVAGSAGNSGAGNSGMTGSGGAGAGTGNAGIVYRQCRFHFGTLDSVARNNPALIAQLDFFTPGWMGSADTFNMQSVCDATKAGATFANQVPAIVAYVAAFYAKRHDNLKDCNAPGTQQDLCVAGAGFISQNLANIVATYESYARGFAACYGTTRPIIFMMEPDYYQYTVSSQAQAWTPALAGQIMGQFVGAIKKYLPNAIFSLDVSPWVGSNGTDNGKAWFANFDMSLFTFINTSGGGTDATAAKIRSANNMTWAGVSQVAGKPIMADTGYGVNGRPAGPDLEWDNPTNINARITDGVASISQYSPSATWATTIAGVRAQLGVPRFCP